MVFVFDSSDSLAFEACSPKTIVAKNMLNLVLIIVGRSFQQRVHHYWNCENALNGLSAATAMNNFSSTSSNQLHFLHCLEPHRPDLLESGERLLQNYQYSIRAGLLLFQVCHH